MGHASVGITWAVYTHLNEAHHKAAASRIGALFGNDSDSILIDDPTQSPKLA